MTHTPHRALTRIALGVFGACAIAWAAPRTHAQPGPDLRPRVLVIVDTSGSMGVDVATGEPTGGDNSREHPGGGGLSRMRVAKDALVGLLETTSEVQFALMRYPQREGLGINRGAIDGAQENTYSNLVERPLNYAGVCEGRLRDPDAATASTLLVPFERGNERRIAAWLDHQESWPADPELRADGPTPLVEALRLAAEYFAEVLPGDPILRCRRNLVLLLSDGGESCLPPDDREDALTAFTGALRSLRVEGADGEPVDVDVRTFAVAFSVGLRAEQMLGLVARAGGTALGPDGRPDPLAGGAYSARDLDGLRAALAVALREAIPVEVCNGLDDDCDGRVDEGVLNRCGACGPEPAEMCNGLDDDCDGLIDEGVLNRCGACGPEAEEICNGLDDDCDGLIDEEVANACGGCAFVEPEVCNGLDDDCDGRVDNQPGAEKPLVRRCGGDVGECRVGVERCVQGEWVDCDGVDPLPERCNGLDDDCDGLVDEDTVPCGPWVVDGAPLPEVGECRVGLRRCDDVACRADPELCGGDGWLLECVGAMGPAEEICDGRDNDCDGEVDEGVLNPCGRCGPLPPEVCNGVDDNCDGRVDEDAACPVGHLCFVGECVLPCEVGGECRPGLACVLVDPTLRVCHPDACAGAACPAGQVCDAARQACVDACAGVECAAGEGCDLGTCVPATCRHRGCPDGERCRGDTCEADSCAGIECGEVEHCRDGVCVAACRGVVCREGQNCVDGECARDPCGGRCRRDQRCDVADGRCELDPCVGVPCPVGMACEEGECRADAACVGIDCPLGTACREGACTDHLPPRAEHGPLPDAGGGGGGEGGGGGGGETPDAGEGPRVDAGAGEGDGGLIDDDGVHQSCGCRAGDDPSGGVGPWSWALGGLLWGVGARVRRRRRGKSGGMGTRWRIARWGVAAGVALLVLSGCDEASTPGGSTDAAPDTTDSRVRDASLACVPSPEECNGRDDDCDGLVDELDERLLVATFNDPLNCGACGVACAANHALVDCRAAECHIVGCVPGSLDLNGVYEDGCEADCVVTGGGVERCDGQDNDCDGLVDEGFDLLSDREHCGACDRWCPDPPDAVGACVAGECVLAECLADRHDLDGDADSGCEYACTVRAIEGVAEFCNGLDDDCDGRVDEAPDLVQPDNRCGELGECAPECEADADCGGPDAVCVGGVCSPTGFEAEPCEDDAACQAVHAGLVCLRITGRDVDDPELGERRCARRQHAPVCDGVDGWRCGRRPTWQPGDEAGRCDGRDNDCDGRTDEDFVEALWEADRVTPRVCTAGVGVCQRSAQVACAADGSRAVCGAEAVAPQTDLDDDCDGLDDDCDGRIDEDFDEGWVTVGAVEIFAYEASRPGADTDADGRPATPTADPVRGPFVEARACSAPDVRPWTQVTWAEAQAACAAAGGRLCSDAEWSLACGGAAGERFPYGAGYVGDQCLGAEHPRSAGEPVPTGSVRTCARAGVYDLSGNVKEWTAESRDGLRVVRGGGYDSALPGGLACDQRDDLKAADFRHPSLGFRCCR